MIRDELHPRETGVAHAYTQRGTALAYKFNIVASTCEIKRFRHQPSV